MLHDRADAGRVEHRSDADGPRFFAHHESPGERHLRLPHTHTTEALDEAVRRLRAAYEVTMTKGRPDRNSGAIDLVA
ncbi:MAG: hypothetical protein ACXWDC_04880 [Aeromicrobium sp.]